jgi:hypothetical protein
MPLRPSNFRAATGIVESTGRLSSATGLLEWQVLVHRLIVAQLTTEFRQWFTFIELAWGCSADAGFGDRAADQQRAALPTQALEGARPGNDGDGTFDRALLASHWPTGVPLGSEQAEVMEIDAAPVEREELAP